MSESLQLSIVYKNGKNLSKEVTSVTAINSVGTFDILLNHEQFVSEIIEKLIWRSNTRVDSVEFGRAILCVKNNLIQVFVGD